ncbi:MAG: hypothetical protein ACI94Y_001266 [Maribacter sp.]|jgi:uncharacterized protein YgiM (DUF1202 family)
MAEKKKTTTKTTKNKTDTLTAKAKQFSKFEVLFVAVMFLCFFAWAFSKCSTQGITSPATNDPNAMSDDMEDTGENLSPAAANNPNSPTYDLNEPTVAVASTVTPQSNGNVEVVNRNNPVANGGTRRSYTPLYVTLQDLKVRTGPSRDSSIVSTLSLNEEVMFMEKRTGFRERINIGTETTNEPWVYVQTQKGHRGWVYGAGIHYFKWDRLKDPIPSISDEDNEGDEE